MRSIYIVLIVIGAILLIIGLPIAFVTFSWTKVKNTVQEGIPEDLQEINIESKCLETKVVIEEITEFSPHAYDILFARESEGGYPLGGVKLIFKNSEGLTKEQYSGIKINELESKNLILEFEEGFIDFEPEEVEVIVYFFDNNNLKVVCNSSTSSLITKTF